MLMCNYADMESLVSAFETVRGPNTYPVLGPPKARETYIAYGKVFLVR
jgi:hypothetical protein